MAPSLRSWLRDRDDFGAAEAHVHTPTAALYVLGSDHRARLRDLSHRLRESWMAPQPHVAAARALAATSPTERVAIYPVAARGGPTWFLQSLTVATPGAAPIVHHDQLAKARLYGTNDDDPFADVPASVPDLVRASRRPELAMAHNQLILDVNDAARQLRMVLFEEGRASFYVGLYRRLHDRRFSREEHAFLLAARPAIRSWFRVASAIGVKPVGDGALVSALEAIGRPALLFRRNRVAWANEAGGALSTEVVAWARAGRPGGFATATRLDACGVELELVLPLRAPPPRRAGIGSLPSSLRSVAEGLLRGLGDREIAAETGMPLATVRTYVARLLRRLDLHDRRDLLRAR